MPVIITLVRSDLIIPSVWFGLSQNLPTVPSTSCWLIGTLVRSDLTVKAGLGLVRFGHCSGLG